MITLFVRGLPRTATEESVTALFSEYGAVRAVSVSRDIFSGQCKGFASIDMEGHEARAAMAALDGSEQDGSTIYVAPDKRKGGRRGRR